MLNSYPLVSVAIVTYNEEKFVEDCINSVISQDYPNFEIVISDDCSQDGTIKILMDYKEKYPEKITVLFAEENCGITKNLNKAHFECRGKYISWLGGDDQMLPGKLSTQVEYMETHESCNICYHNLEVINSFTGELLFYFAEVNKSYSGKVNKIIKYGTFNGACSNMVRQSKTPAKGFDERIPIASDWLYWIETLIDGGEIHYINKVLGRYGKHDSNITALKKLENIEDQLITCAILLCKNPEFSKELIFKESKIFRQLSKMNKNKYKYFMVCSLRRRFSIKFLLLLFLNIVSLDKIKK